jgi:hypothetical protein
MKACRKCGQVKVLSDFYRQRGMKDGHRNNCKSCHSQAHKSWYARNTEYEKARVKKWQQENSERLNAVNRKRRRERGAEYKTKEREGHLRRKYGLRLRDVETLLIAQLGMCAICRRHEGRKLHVDHDHATNRVRGLLCGKCNKAIGLLDDEPRLVRSAETYLRRTRRVSARRRPSRTTQLRLTDPETSEASDS